jgi:predicted transcriptional regulator YheO
VLIKVAESIRSSLSKIALMTLNDMLITLKRCMEPYLESLLKILIKKAALDTNTFIAEEAERALGALCCNCQDQKVLRSLMATTNNG